MTTFRPKLGTREIYHLFNRTVAEESVFKTEESLSQILNSVDYYRFNQRISLSRFFVLTDTAQNDYLNYMKSTIPLVEIYAFSFMPNHFHFQIKQLKEDGISQFISNVQNSFAKYHNLKYSRNGTLFQSSFKSRRIITDEQYIHISRYIHLNHVTSRIIEFDQLLTYPWSSFSWYINPKMNRFINTAPILKHFNSIERYIQFVKDQVDYQRKLKVIKDMLSD